MKMSGNLPTESNCGCSLGINNWAAHTNTETDNGALAPPWLYNRTPLCCWIIFHMFTTGCRRATARAKEHNTEISPHHHDSSAVADTDRSTMLITVNSSSILLVDSELIRAADGLQSNRMSWMV